MGIGKRKPLLSDDLIADVWNTKPLAYLEDELRDFDKLIASAVSRCLAEDEDSRTTISEMMSLVLGKEVSVKMLDAYASPARRDHSVPAHRFLTLIAITRRFDILDAVLREVGGKAIDRSDSEVFKLGKAYVRSINAGRDLRNVARELWGDA